MHLRVRELFEGWLKQLSSGGLLVGTVFFSLSLTPSLLPRSDILQGVLSGCVFAVGYGLGALFGWFWNYFELKLPSERLTRRVLIVVSALCVLMAIYFLWRAPDWQNSIREVMGMPPLEGGHPLRVALIAVLPAAILCLLGALAVHGFNLVSARLSGLVPRRVAFVGALVLVGFATAVLVNGVAARWVLHVVDQSYAELDKLAGQFEAAPTDPARSGSAASLIPWETVGRDARGYVQSGPTPAEIEAITGRPAVAPVRVYVGLTSAETPEDRARLALDEMLRVGAFDRSILVLIMPVGTGWVDPVGIDTLEFLHGGDVASVAMQYSYLTSWVSLVSEPDVGAETAQALFSTVHDYWTQLPRDRRPRLYLYGMSLGAYASEASTLIYDILGDPFQGALWVGPPFANPIRRWATQNREQGTPAWRPRLGNSSSIRFTNQDKTLDIPGATWGPVRMVYLQYPSDPVVFFDPDALWRRPDWLRGPRAPDVSPLLQWYPVVTFLQLSLDLTLSQSAPVGYGHVYAPQDYLDAWIAVTDPKGRTTGELRNLRGALSRTGSIENISIGWFRRPAERPGPRSGDNMSSSE